jgi:hypothetical protein
LVLQRQLCKRPLRSFTTWQDICKRTHKSGIKTSQCIGAAERPDACRVFDIQYIYQSCEAIMRTLVDIPDRQIEDLTAICEREKLSRAEVIRRAISMYLDKKKTGQDAAFGLWKDQQVDGLAYQEQVRAEW